MFRFVFAEMKTDTFENALVWIFLLFYSPKPHSQERILTYRNWLIYSFVLLLTTVSAL